MGKKLELLITLVLTICVVASLARAEDYQLRNPEGLAFGLRAPGLTDWVYNNHTWDFNHPSSDTTLSIDEETRIVSVDGVVYGGEIGAQGLWRISGRWFEFQDGKSYETRGSHLTLTALYDGGWVLNGNTFLLNAAPVAPNDVSLTIQDGILKGWTSYIDPTGVPSGDDIEVLLVAKQPTLSEPLVCPEIMPEFCPTCPSANCSQEDLLLYTCENNLSLVEAELPQFYAMRDELAECRAESNKLVGEMAQEIEILQLDIATEEEKYLRQCFAEDGQPWAVHWFHSGLNTWQLWFQLYQEDHPSFDPTEALNTVLEALR